MRSRRPLRSTTSRLIWTSLDFEPMVLISRPISCTTNSSFRPEEGLASRISLVLVEVGPQSGDFLVDVGAVGVNGDLADQVARLDRDALLLEQRAHAVGQSPVIRRRRRAALSRRCLQGAPASG